MCSREIEIELGRTAINWSAEIWSKTHYNKTT